MYSFNINHFKQIEKENLFNMNFNSENQLYKFTKIDARQDEIEINNAFKNLFFFDLESIESKDIIKDNDIYYILYHEEKDKKQDFINNMNQKTNSISQQNSNQKNESKKAFIGRKKKNSGEIGNHNRDSFDNKARKIKHVVLEDIRVFINKKVQKVYKLKKFSKEYEIKKINQNQTNNSNINFNKIFIHKTLKEILSDKTTTKNHCNREHNKILIEKLIKEKNNIFGNIFNLTFLDVLQFLTGQRKDLVQLNGLSFPEKLKAKDSSDKEYSESLFYIMENIEKILSDKKSRNKKKKSLD